MSCHSSSPTSHDGGRDDDSVVLDVAAFDDSGIDDARPDAPSLQYAVARSGTRLKLSWWQTSDGVRAPAAGVFYDSELTQTCRPSTWADASFLCIPSYTSIDSVYTYTDAACTTPIISGGLYAPGTYFAAYHTTAQCSDVLIDQMFTPGIPVIPPATVYLKSGSVCSPGSAHGNYYAAVPVPQSTFVPVTVSYDALGGNVDQKHWDSPDGMRWYRPEGFDKVLNAACHYQAESNTVADCDPRGTEVTAYSDAACMMPMVTDPIGCTPPAFARASSLCLNQIDHRVFSIGAQTSPSVVYNASCTPGNPDIHSSYYSVAPVAVGNVQTLSRSAGTGGTARLKPIFFDAVGLHYQTDYFFDSTLNAECAFGGSNGVGACVPTQQANTKVLYSDFGCTTPFDAVQVNDDLASCGTSPSPTPSYGVKILGVGMREFHRVTTQHLGVVYQNIGACRRYPETGIPQSWRIFEVDPAVTPDSAFQAASVVIDP